MPRDMTAEPLSTCDMCGAHAWAVQGGAPPEKMVHDLGCPRVGARACEWCGGPLGQNAPPNTVTCQARCRAAKWKREKHYGRAAQTEAPRPRAGVNARSGLQVSHPKAVAVVAHYLRARNVGSADKVARTLIDGCLSEKQRARAKGRS